MELQHSGKNRIALDWPEERAGGDTPLPRWSQPDSNICLDFHGDPRNAQLIVFSDGNHHMALQECLDLFLNQHPSLTAIFYTTTPPGPMVKMVKAGGLRIGNLIIRAAPHVLISPPHVLDNLVAEGLLSTHLPFMQNRGSVLLVRRGNPKNILKVADLARRDLRLFLSNPESEAVSHRGYTDTLQGLAAAEGIALSLSGEPNGPEVVYGERIHHREAPQALADDRADVAIVYYHLALRYVRIFPALFDMVPLGTTALNPQPVPGNVISRSHAAIVGDGGRFGAEFLRFLSSEAVGDIYEHHGLSRAGC